MRPAALFALACTACSAQIAVPFEGEPGDLAVVAVTDTAGAVVRVERYRIGQPSVGLALAGGEHAYRWTLRARALMAPDGMPLPSEALDAVAAAPRSRAAPPGSCGRCLFPATRPPFMIHAGDRCPIPPGVAGAPITGEPAPRTAEEVARDVVLEWPGECPCAPAPASPAPPAFDLAFRPGSAWPPESISVDDGGVTGVFGERFAARIELAGRRVETEDVPFSGPVYTSVPLSDGSFLVASRTPQGRGFQFDHFDARLAHTRRGDDVDLEVHTALRLRGKPGVILGGRGVITGPVALSCPEDTAPMGCETILSRLELFSEREVQGIVELDDGTLVAIGNRGTVSAGRQLGGNWEWRTATAGTAPWTDPGSGVRYRIDRMVAIGRAGGRVLVCADSLDPAPYGAVVLSSSISRALFDVPGAKPSISLAAIFPGVSCLKITAVPGEPSAARLLIRDGPGLAIDFGADGKPRGSLVAHHVLTNVPDFIQECASNPAGFTWARTRDGSAYARDDRRRDGAFVQVHGRAPGARTDHVAMVAAGEEVLAITSAPTLQTIRPGAAGGEMVVREVPLTGAGGGDRFGVVLGAARDPADGTLVAVGFSPAGTWIRRIYPAQGTVTEIPAALPADVRMFAIAALGPHLMAIAAEQRKLFILDGDALRELPMEWDDPFTPEQETGPEPWSECEVRRLIDRPAADHGRDLWRSLEAADGVAWASGCGGVLARVTPWGAEHVALTRGPQTLHLPGVLVAPNLSAVHAICPDHAVVASKGINDLTLDVGRVWEVVPFADAPGASPSLADTLVVRNYSPADSLGIGADKPDLGVPLDVLGVGGSISIVASRAEAIRPKGTVLTFPGRQRFDFGLAFTTAAQLPSGTILAGTDTGLVVIGRPRPR